MKCYQCGQSHEHQRADYPVGTTIIFQDAFAKQYKCPSGKVVGHCDDGRASVEFPTTGEIHTFHYTDYFKSVEIPVTRDVVEQLTAALTDAQSYNAQLVNDLAAAQKRNNELEQTLSTYRTGAMQYSDTLDELHRRIAELEAAQDGRTYSEGCKP